MSLILEGVDSSRGNHKSAVHLPSVCHLKIQGKLGRCSEDPDTFMARFQILTLAFDVYWREIQLILVSSCAATEKKAILKAAYRMAEEIFARIPIGNYPEVESIHYILLRLEHMDWDGSQD
jgi:hypothetical protein